MKCLISQETSVDPQPPICGSAVFNLFRSNKDSDRSHLIEYRSLSYDTRALSGSVTSSDTSSEGDPSSANSSKRQPKTKKRMGEKKGSQSPGVTHKDSDSTHPLESLCTNVHGEIASLESANAVQFDPNDISELRKKHIFTARASTSQDEPQNSGSFDLENTPPRISTEIRKELHTATNESRDSENRHGDVEQYGGLHSIKDMIQHQYATLQALSTESDFHPKKLDKPEQNFQKFDERKIDQANLIEKLKVEKESFASETLLLREEMKEIRLQLDSFKKTIEKQNKCALSNILLSNTENVVKYRPDSGDALDSPIGVGKECFFLGEDEQKEASHEIKSLTLLGQGNETVSSVMEEKNTFPAKADEIIISPTTREEEGHISKREGDVISGKKGNVDFTQAQHKFDDSILKENESHEQRIDLPQLARRPAQTGALLRRTARHNFISGTKTMKVQPQDNESRDSLSRQSDDSACQIRTNQSVLWKKDWTLLLDHEANIAKSEIDGSGETDQGTSIEATESKPSMQNSEIISFVERTAESTAGQRKDAHSSAKKRAENCKQNTKISDAISLHDAEKATPENMVTTDILEDTNERSIEAIEEQGTGFTYRSEKTLQNIAATPSTGTKPQEDSRRDFDLQKKNKSDALSAFQAFKERVKLIVETRETEMDGLDETRRVVDVAECRRDMEFVQQLLQKYLALEMPDSVVYKSPRHISMSSNEPVVEIANRKHVHNTVEKRSATFITTEALSDEDDDVFDGIDSNDEEDVERREAITTSLHVKPSEVSKISDLMKDLNQSPIAHTKDAYTDSMNGRHVSSIGGETATVRADDQCTKPKVTYQKQRHLRKRGQQLRQRRQQRPLQQPPPPPPPMARQQNGRMVSEGHATFGRPPPSTALQKAARFKQRSKEKDQRIH